ncbi:MAG: alpha/beta fold hydrolase [Myxococcota bacterium]
MAGAAGAPIRPWRRWQRHGWILLALAVAVAFAWGPVARHVRAASALLRFEQVEEGVGGWVAEVGRQPVVREDLTLDTEAGAVRARRYRPKGNTAAPPLLLVHGVHFRGMDEPRLVQFARVLASAGLDVVTPHVPSLVASRVEPAATRLIGASAAAMAEQTASEAVGVMGISFAGGLALLAAADPAYEKHIGYVAAVGAHQDLVRVARWFAGHPARGPDGEVAPVEPHPYGAGVIIHRHVEAFFPSEDVPKARKALELLLHERWEEARAKLPTLSEEGQKRLRAMLWPDEDRAALQRTMLGVIDEERDTFRTVSPIGKLGDLQKPVLLIHGTHDPVVPSTETLWIARELPRGSLEEVVVTPLLRHAERKGDEPQWRQRWNLVHFLARLLALSN